MNKGVVFLNFPSTKSKPDNFLGNQTGKLMGVRFRCEREREVYVLGDLEKTARRRAQMSKNPNQTETSRSEPTSISHQLRAFIARELETPSGGVKTKQTKTKQMKSAERRAAQHRQVSLVPWSFQYVRVLSLHNAF